MPLKAPGARRGGPGVRLVAEAFTGLLTDRAFRLALLFSLAAHGLVFFLWRGTAGEAEEPPRRTVMVARLVRSAPPPPAPAAEGRERGGSEDSAPPSPAEPARPPAAASSTGMAAPQTAAVDGAGEEEQEQEAEAGLSAAAGAAAAPRAAGRASLVFDSPSAGPALRVAALVPAPGAAARTLPLAAAGPLGRTAPSPPSALPDLLDEIRRRIDSQKFYPRLARRNGWEGEVLVELSLAGDGALEAVQVVRPSAYPILDEVTLAAVKRAGPFPPLPGRVRVPVSYRLERKK